MHQDNLKNLLGLLRFLNIVFVKAQFSEIIKIIEFTVKIVKAEYNICILDHCRRSVRSRFYQKHREGIA